MMRLAADKRVVLACVLTAVMAEPASAFWPVIDVSAITKLVTQIQQTESLVQSARQNLASLPSSLRVTDIQGRLGSVTGILQRAQSLCSGSLRGRVAPRACTIAADIANAQAAGLGAEMQQIQVLQGAARGSGGALAAQQATAHALVELTAQIVEMRQLQTGAALQKQYDDAALDRAMHGGSTVQPYK